MAGVGVFVVGNSGAAAVVVFSKISASISWSEGMIMGTFAGRVVVSAPAAVMIGAVVEVGFGLAGAAGAACCALNRSLRSGS